MKIFICKTNYHSTKNVTSDKDKRSKQGQLIAARSIKDEGDHLKLLKLNE